MSGLFNRFGDKPSYRTPRKSPGPVASRFPSLAFYWRILVGPVSSLCWQARRGRCDDRLWIEGSARCVDILEACGARMEIEGLDILRRQDRPCVIIANHMSTLETFILPSVVRPYMPVTFVVKESLTKMPFFGYVMRSRDPVVVGRINPREDLEAVLKGGAERLGHGVSLIVFPQSTRSLDVDESHFNSIGVKLARKARVPIIPLALKTDAWGNGRRIKELGAIRPELPVRFKFGSAIEVEGRGKEEQARIYEFIAQTVQQWQKQDGVNR